MKTLALGIGLLAGAAVAVSVVSSVYPDIPRRIARDSRRWMRGAKRTVSQFGH
ncbi:MAG: hypothetical protein FWF10_11985 [Clostridiales bacterium]|nr:hypothetical protein [Clostridiales bacterium]